MTPAGLVPRASVCSCLPMNDDIESVIKNAKNIRPTYRSELLNPLSSLPEPKVKLKAAIKDRIRLLAGAYISLAGFVDDDDAKFAEKNPESEKTKAIYLKILDDMETAQKEMRRFRIFDSN
jgi:hypothetical protein